MKRHTRRLICAIAALAFWVTTMAPATAQEIHLGLGYDRSKDGHGFELHQAGDSLVLYFYTFDLRGEPEWFLGVAELDNGVLFGNLNRYTWDEDQAEPLQEDTTFDGEFRLDYASGPESAICNTRTDRSEAEDLASFYWRIGEEQATWCTEFLRVGDSHPEDNYRGGVWFAGVNDSGYGVTMSHMGRTETALVYYYDAEGDPRWALGAADTDAGVVSVTHYNGFCRQCDPRPLDPIPAGFVEYDWDPDGAPSQRTSRGVIDVSYPNSPGGLWRREFTLNRISDGASMASYVVNLPFNRAIESQFAVAWQVDGVNDGVRGKPLGPRPAPLSIPNSTKGLRLDPAIGVAQDGSYVVVWEDDSDGNHYFNIRAASFNADGTPRLAEFSVHEDKAGQQRRPDIAVQPNGDFVVVWEDDYRSIKGPDIRGRGFFADGSEKMPYQRLNDSNPGSQRVPSVDYSADGRYFAVAWLDDDDHNGLYDVEARLFTASGSPLTGDVGVATRGNGSLDAVDVAVTADGDFMAVWSNFIGLGSYSTIYAASFDISGNARGQRREVPERRRDDNYWPAIDATADGNFIVAWASHGKVKVSGLNRDGGLLFDERILNSTRTDFIGVPAVAGASDGTTLVVWPYLRDRGSLKLRGRPINDDGLMGAEVLINQDARGRAVKAAVSAR